MRFASARTSGLLSGACAFAACGTTSTTAPAPNAVAARRLATRRPCGLLITPPLRATAGPTRCLSRGADRLLPRRAAALRLDRQAAREPVQRHARDAQFAR